MTVLYARKILQMDKLTPSETPHFTIFGIEKVLFHVVWE